MDRRHEDRDRRDHDGSWGRDRSRYDQHDRDRDRYRQTDDYIHRHEGHEQERGSAGHFEGPGERSHRGGERGGGERGGGGRQEERRWSERSGGGYASGSPGSQGRGRSWEHGGANPQGGANDRARFDYRDAEERPTYGRYEYGASEDRRSWGEPRPGDGEGMSRVGEGPRRDEPYRSPSEQDRYAMYREGNHSGYDTWHGHNYFQSHNDADAMGSRPIRAWEREERGGEREGEQMRSGGRDRRDDRAEMRRDEHHPSPIHGRPEEGGWSDFRQRDEWQRDERRREDYGWRSDERMSEWDREDRFRDDRRRDDRERDDRGRGDLSRRDEGREQGGGERDISRTWRMFDSWGDTDYGRQRGQGFGWHRGDDYGDRGN